MIAARSEVSYELSQQYFVDDFPSRYREVVLTRMQNREKFVFRAVQKIFLSGGYKGRKMVEVGCGPTVHRLAIPSKYYEEIITSDYTSDNKESVRKWVANDPDALDWTPIFEVAAEVEGYSDVSSGAKEIEDRIRQKIKSVTHCDVLKESIFDPLIERVDLLLTFGCLEAVCPTLESFAAAVKNLGRYVKKDGHLLTRTVLGMSLFEGIKVLNVSEDFVTEAIEDAGFSIEHRFFKENDGENYEFDGHLVVMAKKR